MFLFDAALDWLAHGLLAATWSASLLDALAVTSITIGSLTLDLHGH